MAGSVNNVLLIGNLGRDPEVRTFQNGGQVCNMTIATSETWKDKNTGEKRERTEWHRVSILNDALVRIAQNYLRKGSKVCVQGRLETRKWQDQSGQDKFSTEVVLRPFNGELTLLGGGSDGQSGSQSGSDGQTGGGSGQPGGGSRDIDDEIPF